MPDSNLAERAEALTRTVGALTESVDALATAHSHTRRTLHWTVLGLVLDLVLTVAAALLFRGQQVASERLADQGVRISEVQQRTSDRVLCPLYTLMLSFESRASTTPTLSEAERQERLKAYAVIHEGYGVLGCR